MYCSSDVKMKDVSSDACPRMSVPLDGFSCEVSEPRFELPTYSEAGGVTFSEGSSE